MNTQQVAILLTVCVCLTTIDSLKFNQKNVEDILARVRRQAEEDIPGNNTSEMENVSAPNIPTGIQRESFRIKVERSANETETDGQEASKTDGNNTLRDKYTCERKIRKFVFHDATVSILFAIVMTLVGIVVLIAVVMVTYAKCRGRHIEEQPRPTKQSAPV